MNTRAMIRHPLLAASLGAAVVALPASALYLYGSGHPAEAAGNGRRRQRARDGAAARSAAPVVTGLPDFRHSYRPMARPWSTSASART